MREFISEDDLKTFEGWLKYHCVDPSGEEALEYRKIWDEIRANSTATQKVGLMKLPPLVTAEYRYAVALRDGSDLWLALWVRRSARGEFFVMAPRADKGWDSHTSYHLDGTLHMKSHGRIPVGMTPNKRQPLTGPFRGAESLGIFGGYGPKSVGAICDPSAFSGVVEVAPGVLGPRDGLVTVDLVEPNCGPMPFPWKQITRREVFRDFIPWVVITVGSSS
jgi:hypothetical protein